MLLLMLLLTVMVVLKRRKPPSYASTEHTLSTQHVPVCLLQQGLSARFDSASSDTAAWASAKKQ